MHFFKLAIILIGTFFVENAFGQDGVKSWIIRRTEMYSPNSATLLKLYDRLPSHLSVDYGGSVISTSKYGDAYHYLDLDSYESALHSMSTNVHEIGHGYGGIMYFDETIRQLNGGRISFGNINQGFYMEPQDQFWIDIEKPYIFPSRRLTSTIPSDLITFRFNTYVNGTSSTQSQGVIGLLDEMNAYYLGSRYDYDMFPVYKEIYPSDYLNQWVMETMSSMTAYFEFDFFIKEYLMYAKNSQPQTYSYLRNNAAFKSTYQKIHTKFSQLVKTYEAKVNREKASAQFNYDSPFMDEDYVRLRARLNSGIYRSIEADFLNN